MSDMYCSASNPVKLSLRLDNNILYHLLQLFSHDNNKIFPLRFEDNLEHAST